VAAIVTGLGLVIVAGCSGSGARDAAVAPAVTAMARDLLSYDAFVLGSADNNPLSSDIYGIRFTPLTIDRITTNKRVSSLGADANHLLVAAGDEDIDKLAEVTGSGELLPIPGLGRPHAFSPALRAEVMYFDDSEGDRASGINRYFAWDLNKRTKG
jgi:hypothetical protein